MMLAVDFEAIAAATGLAPLVATGAVRSALASVGCAPEEATARHYREALPHLRARLEGYLAKPEADARMAQIEAMLTA
jgi:hypothetical protein